MPRRHQLPRRFGRDGSPFDTGRLSARQRWIAEQSIIRYERHRTVTIALGKGLALLEKPC